MCPVWPFSCLFKVPLNIQMLNGHWPAPHLVLGRGRLQVNVTFRFINLSFKLPISLSQCLAFGITFMLLNMHSCLNRIPDVWPERCKVI